MSEVNDQVRQLVASLNGKHGILGCLLVGRDGTVICSSLPQQIEVATIGSLSATLFSNNVVSWRGVAPLQMHRLDRGNLIA